MNRWERITQHYREAAPAFARLPANRWAIDPYAWDFQAGISMTPIEAALWHDIRSISLVMYPQYPVAGHFVDFGNPIARVAIECDGRAFHTDTDADARRQARIEGAGWTVYRLTGSQCVATDQHRIDELGRERWEPNPAAVKLIEIGIKHGVIL